MDKTDFILDRDLSVADMAPIVRAEEHGLPGTEQWPVAAFLEREPSKKWYLVAEEDKVLLDDHVRRTRLSGRFEGLLFGLLAGYVSCSVLWVLAS